MSASQVPLRPIAKGSVAKFWAAMAVLVAIAFIVAHVSISPLKGETSESGVNIRVLEEGEGEPMTADDAAMVEYRGSLAATGEVFDENFGSPRPMIAEGLIPGFTEALLSMREGGRYRVFIPASQGYGAESPGEAIPANSDLVFEVNVLEIGRGLAPLLRQQMMGPPPPTAPLPTTDPGASPTGDPAAR